jgi:hypothetical protein
LVGLLPPTQHGTEVSATFQAHVSSAFRQAWRKTERLHHNAVGSIRQTQGVVAIAYRVVVVVVGGGGGWW